MINYYRPELTVHFEDRLLHFQPSGGWGTQDCVCGWGPHGDFWGGGPSDLFSRKGMNQGSECVYLINFNVSVFVV